MNYRIEYNKDNNVHGGDYVFVEVNEYKKIGKDVFTKLTNLLLDRIVEINKENFYDSNGNLIEES